MKKFDFSKEFGNIDPKYIEEAEREWSEKKENRREIHCSGHKTRIFSNLSFTKNFSIV